MTTRPPAPSNIDQAHARIAPELARLLYDLRDELPMFTVYDHPLDFPKDVVARLWTTLPERRQCNLVVRADTVDKLQVLMERIGLHRLGRMPEDDPAILEVWL